MNSAIGTREGQFAGVGFAIPVNMIRSMLPTLIKGESITRGMIGVAIQDVTPELAEQFRLSGNRGALVSQVNRDSPAEKAGLKPGDVIVRFNGRGVADTSQLRNFVAASKPGSKASVAVVRNGREESVTVTIGKMLPETVAAAKPAPGAENSLAGLGFSLQTLDGELARRFGVNEERGVLVTGVEPGSRAAMADLEAGDLIVEADRKPVSTVEELQAIFAQGKPRILLLVKRDNISLFIVLRLR